MLGFHYMEGLGVVQSYTEATRWSKLAADQGHGGAAYNLAKMAKMYSAAAPASLRTALRPRSGQRSRWRRGSRIL